MTSKVVAPKFNLHIPPREMLPVQVVSTTPVSSTTTPTTHHHHHQPRSPASTVTPTSFGSPNFTFPNNGGGNGNNNTFVPPPPAPPQGFISSSPFTIAGSTAASLAAQLREEQWHRECEKWHNITTPKSTPTPSTIRGVPRAFEATRVLPLLYLGSYFDAASASELRSRNIRRVVNIAKECAVSASCLESQSWLQIRKYDIDDHSDEDIEGFFADATQFIHEGISNGEAVLVHCKQGVSRSTTIVLAYLMQYGFSDFGPSERRAIQQEAATARLSMAPCLAELLTSDAEDRVGSCACLRARGLPGMCYTAAFDFVKAKRPFVSPNLGFVLALHELDRHRNVSTPDI